MRENPKNDWGGVAGHKHNVHPGDWCLRPPLNQMSEALSYI